MVVKIDTVLPVQKVLFDYTHYYTCNSMQNLKNLKSAAQMGVLPKCLYTKLKKCKSIFFWLEVDSSGLYTKIFMNIHLYLWIFFYIFANIFVYKQALDSITDYYIQL